MRRASTFIVEDEALIRMMLVEMLEGLSGSDLSGADPSTTFVEMGFDSLFLTQVTQALQARFGMRITFRQLLAEVPTLGALANYLDGKLPAEAFVSEAGVAASSRTAHVSATAMAPRSELRPAATTTTESGVAAALLLGENSAMAGEDWEKYVRTGVIHVLAISGQHLVVLGAFLWFLCRLIGVRRRRVAIIS